MVTRRGTISQRQPVDLVVILLLALVLGIAVTPSVTAQTEDCLLPAYRVQPGDTWIGVLSSLGIAWGLANVPDVWWPIADLNGRKVLGCAEIDGTRRCTPLGQWTADSTTHILLDVPLQPGETIQLKVPAALCPRIGLVEGTPIRTEDRQLIYVEVQFGSHASPLPLSTQQKDALNSLVRKYLLPESGHPANLPSYDLAWLTEVPSVGADGQHQPDCKLHLEVGTRVENHLESACVVVSSRIPTDLCECLHNGGQHGVLYGAVTPFLARHLRSPETTAYSTGREALSALYERYGRCRNGGTWRETDFFAMWRYTEPPQDSMSPQPNFFLGIRPLDTLNEHWVPHAGFSLKLDMICPTADIGETGGDSQATRRLDLLNYLARSEEQARCD